ncbi:Nup93/Nic96-domain-containing protein [Zychaea mexicana]|uniref:Nup93/Nic96-domain-containing protein n=1 Tax=Zychaea mexicana TaxID=64656 RepID=UPI0022FDBD3E|nr:Nup93/Nic96-domain-containing protein [Zychaea mexicana]KAI9494890.1 Nup93/Nic96-domain-containing protein [Zychaea mexicana]
MATETFKKLYESSKLLASPTTRDQLPVLERGLDQIDTETRRLFGKNKADQEQTAQAHFFLAQNGINTQDLAQKLNAMDTGRIFEPSGKINDTDVEKYLEKAHERSIIDVITEYGQNTQFDFEEEAERVMEANLRKTQRRVLEGWDHHQHHHHHHHQGSNVIDDDRFLMPAATSPASRQRVLDYAAVISKMNDARVARKSFPVVEEFAKLSKSVDSDQVHDRNLDIWKLLYSLAGEAAYDNGAEYSKKRYAQLQPGEPVAVSMTRKLIDSAKSWLEKQFTEYIDDELVRHATQAKVGGVPSPAHRLRVFMDLKFRKGSEKWTDSRFEIVNGTAIWTYLYLLIRSGYAKQALAYVKENEQLFSAEPQFVRYFTEYMESPDRRLRKATHDAVVADYQRLEYGQQNADPYKLILYKIIGRCGLNKKRLPEIGTTEDYMWLQLSLVRESVDGEAYDYERYNLNDIQKLILSFNPNEFDQNGTNPRNYFMVLLLTLQFERAVNYLYKNEKTRVEAVHFAIALAYHGLLRIPVNLLTSSIDLLIVEDDERVSFNFSRLIYQYIRIFAASNEQNALNYIYLLTLYSDWQRHDSDDMITLSHTYIQELVLGSKDPKAILGVRSPEQGRQRGWLDAHKELIGITSERAFVQAILQPLAEKYAQEGRYSEAVFVYELTGDYNEVVDILNKQLGDALQQPRATDPDQMLRRRASDEEIINLSLKTLGDYEKQQHIGVLIKESKKHTVRVLIDFLRSRSLYEEGSFEQALHVIHQSGVIPLQDDLGLVQRTAEQFERLDEGISKNVPDMLLMVTDMLFKLWTTFTGPQLVSQPAAKETVARIEENIRAVLAFVGLIQFKMPADTVTKLNKAEMMMSAHTHRLSQ